MSKERSYLKSTASQLSHEINWAENELLRLDKSKKQHNKYRKELKHQIRHRELELAFIESEISDRNE